MSRSPRRLPSTISHDEAERPFYGVSMFETAFFHYDKKVKLYYITHIAAQRAACGLRVGTMKPNPNAADKNNFTQALANLGLAQYIVLPDADWTVTNLKEEGNFDFLGLINHHNSQMSKSMLAPGSMRRREAARATARWWTSATRTTPPG